MTIPNTTEELDNLVDKAARGSMEKRAALIERVDTTEDKRPSYARQLDRLIIEQQTEDGSIDISDQAVLRDEILSWHQSLVERLTRENHMLISHLAYMAGEFEGSHGHKNGYLLKNWPEYAELTELKGDVSLCSSCHCMTHTVDSKCGKCGESKEDV